MQGGKSGSGFDFQLSEKVVIVCWIMAEKGQLLHSGLAGDGNPLHPGAMAPANFSVFVFIFGVLAIVDEVVSIFYKLDQGFVQTVWRVFGVRGVHHAPALTVRAISVGIIRMSQQLVRDTAVLHHHTFFRHIGKGHLGVHDFHGDWEIGGPHLASQEGLYVPNTVEMKFPIGEVSRKEKRKALDMVPMHMAKKYVDFIAIFLTRFLKFKAQVSAAGSKVKNEQRLLVWQFQSDARSIAPKFFGLGAWGGT